YVPFELPVQSLTQLTRRDELPFLAREWRVVDHEVDGDRRLFDGDPRETLRRLDVRDRVADLHAFQSRERNDLARGRLLDLGALESLEAVELRDARVLVGLIGVEGKQRNRIPDVHDATFDAA